MHIRTCVCLRMCACVSMCIIKKVRNIKKLTTVLKEKKMIINIIRNNILKSYKNKRKLKTYNNFENIDISKNI